MKKLLYWIRKCISGNNKACKDVVKKAKVTDRTGYGKVQFQRCDTWLKGDQINLWTYWQGYQLDDIDEKGVDILLVGQDWGNPKRNPRLLWCII